MTNTHAARVPGIGRVADSGARESLIGLGNEVHKGLLAAWSERLQILIELPLFIVFFLLIAAVTGRGREVVATGEISWSFDTEQVSWMFVGFVAFTFFYLQSVKLFWRLLGEIQSGTLEQVYLSPLPSWLVAAAGRVVAAVVETVVVVGIMYMAAMPLVDFDIPWRAEALVPLVFLMSASVGYSLLLGGLTLVLKRVEVLADLMLVPAFVASGLFVPLDRMPDWLAAVGRVMPVTHGLESLREIMFSGRSFDVMWGDGGLAWVVVSAGAWLLLGIAGFAAGERYAKRNGSLSHA